jgi:hypothetical protein
VVPTATELPAAPCNIESCAPSAALAWTQTEPEARWSTGYATRAPPSSNAGVSVYALMKLLGHESMVTSQRYVTATGTETCTAAAQNRLYGLIEKPD